MIKIALVCDSIHFSRLKHVIIFFSYFQHVQSSESSQGASVSANPIQNKNFLFPAWSAGGVSTFLHFRLRRVMRFCRGVGARDGAARPRGARGGEAGADPPLVLLHARLQAECGRGHWDLLLAVRHQAGRLHKVLIKGVVPIRAVMHKTLSVCSPTASASSLKSPRRASPATSIASTATALFSR